MPVLALIINEIFAIKVQDTNRYLASTSVFVFGVALVSGLLNSDPVVPKGNPETGVVKWFNTAKGFGFITLEGGRDVFVHYRDILGKGHRSLATGTKGGLPNRKGPERPAGAKGHRVGVSRIFDFSLAAGVD